MHEKWFADEEGVRKAVGILEKPLAKSPNFKEVSYDFDCLPCYYLQFTTHHLILNAFFFVSCRWLAGFVSKTTHVTVYVLLPVLIFFAMHAGKVCLSIAHLD